MLRNLFVFPDGTELTSGVGTTNAIKSVKVTQTVNDQTEFSLGSVCSSMLEATIITPYGGLNIPAGGDVTLYKINDSGMRHLVGLYTLEKPTRPTANTYRITAYDRVSWLDKDLSEWLAGLTDWPIRLLSFAKLVCAECGLTLTNETIPNGDYLVPGFSGSGITGRKLMQWVGEVCARFLYAAPDGSLEFSKFRKNTLFAIVPSGQKNDMNANNVLVPFFAGSLTYSDFQTAPIEKVQIRLTADDIGVMYPDVSETSNAYVIQGNYLLTASTADILLPVAQKIYEEISDISYTPCRVSIPACLDIKPGDIISITDKNGITINTFVMTKTTAGQRDTLECTGSPRRDSSFVLNNEEFRDWNGKILEIRKQIDGLTVKNADSDGRIAQLEMTVDGINAKVESQKETIGQVQQDMTTIQQSAESVSIQVQHIIDNGVSKVTTGKGYEFGDDGMHISDPASEVKNLIDHTGMMVSNTDEIVLQANKDGVNTLNLTVRKYLIVPGSRFEEYADGTGKKFTACFTL